MRRRHLVTTGLAAIIAQATTGIASAQSEISDGVSYELDITILDPEPGQLPEPLLVGSKVYKKWQVRNTGTQDWHDCVLVIRYGFSPQAFKNQGLRLRDYVVAVPVPDLKSGQSGEVGFELTVPPITGEYTMYFDVAKRSERRDILTVVFRAVTQ